MNKIYFAYLLALTSIAMQAMQPGRPFEPLQPMIEVICYTVTLENKTNYELTIETKYETLATNPNFEYVADFSPIPAFKQRGIYVQCHRGSLPFIALAPFKIEINVTDKLVPLEIPQPISQNITYVLFQNSQGLFEVQEESIYDELVRTIPQIEGVK